VAQISLEYSSPPQIDDNLTITACEEIEGENKANFDLIEVYNHYADSNLDVKGYKDEDLTDPITNADDPNAYHANNNDHIYVVVTNKTTHCSSVVDVRLEVIPLPEAHSTTLT